MKKTFLLLILTIFTNLLLAQDVDIYHKNKNANYKLPAIPGNMTFEEFELLSQNIRMKDWIFAGIVPGYIHFKAREPKTGYWLIGIRSASYITVGVTYLIERNKFNNIQQTQTDFLQGNYRYLYLVAFATALSTYLYDVIHGDYKLHEKQEKIRYKYAIKLSRDMSVVPGNHGRMIPSFAITWTF